MGGKLRTVSASFFRNRGSAVLYVLATAAYAALFAAFKFIPTQDGPAHLASAVVFQSLLAGGSPYAGFYQLNITAAPYWTYHLLMMPLLAAFPPLIAEKVFLVGYVVAFAAAAWYVTKAAAGKRSGLGVLFLLFATSFPFQMGFYNYMLGLALALGTVAFYWRGADQGGGASAALLPLMLVACYFTHLLAWVMAAAAVVALSLWRSFFAPGRRRELVALLYLAPTVVLPAYYLATTPHSGEYHWHSARWLAEQFVLLRPMASFSAAQRFVGYAVALLFLLLVGAAVVSRARAGRWRPRPADGFAVVALVFVGLYFAAPASTPHKAFFLSERLALWPYFFLLLWLAAELPGRVRRAVTVAAVTLVAVNLVLLVASYRRENAKLATFTSGHCVVGRGRVLLPLIKDPTVRGRKVEVLHHAVSYYVIENCSCNLVDMAANTYHFPVIFGPGVAPPACAGSFSNLRVYDVESSVPRPDYVIAYDLNPFLPPVWPLFEQYRPVHYQGKLIIYEKKKSGE